MGSIPALSTSRMRSANLGTYSASSALRGASGIALRMRSATNSGLVVTVTLTARQLNWDYAPNYGDSNPWPLGRVCSCPRYYELFPSGRVQVLEDLGYGTVWIAGNAPGDLEIPESVLASTKSVAAGTAIVNVWAEPADKVAASFHRVEQRHRGRFLLGVGIGHREAIGDAYQKPYQVLSEYVDRLLQLGFPGIKSSSRRYGRRCCGCPRTEPPEPSHTSPRWNTRRKHARLWAKGRCWRSSRASSLGKTRPQLARLCGNGR